MTSPCSPSAGTCPWPDLTLPADDVELDNLFAFLEPICEGEGRTPKMMAQMMLVCEEVFVNICRYGFPDGQPRLPVDIEAAVDERAGCLHLVFSDQGIATTRFRTTRRRSTPPMSSVKAGWASCSCASTWTTCATLAPTGATSCV